MKNRCLLFGCMLLLAIAARSQGVQQNEKPYIEVNGTAEKEVVPDEIYISITLTERYDGRNKITIEDQEKQLKDIIKNLGIDMANLSLSNADASYVKINWLNKDVMAKKSYSLKVGDAAMVGRVFQSLEDINIKDASVYKEDYSQKEVLKKTLRIEALQKAKDQATYMLQAIGQAAGKPLYIHEGISYAPMFTANLMKNNAAAQNQQEANVDGDYLQFKKMKFTSTVDARFEIK